MRFLVMGFLLTACADQSYDRGMIANIQTRGEYAQFRRDNPRWNPNQNAPLTFDPEAGGWEVRR